MHYVRLEIPLALFIEGPAAGLGPGREAFFRPDGHPPPGAPLRRGAPLPVRPLRQLLSHASPAPGDSRNRLAGGGERL